MSKVSVIVPNYNGGTYIEKCIDSIIKQSYKDIEIIIIDDGSIDDSLEKIINLQKIYSNLICISQTNLNASIARNKGIDKATGKYVLFLDSDDILLENAISNLVVEMENNNVDLVIGNFVSVDENGNLVNNYNVVKEAQIVKNTVSMVGTVPNPSNKLFKLDIIKKNNIYFGNVRIGQDLNFYLKYLIFCKTISLIEDNIYKWTMINSSMSNTYNFRIFDIVESFKDVRRFYEINRKLDIYNSYIKMIEYRHYYLQMEKQKYFRKRKLRNVVVDYFKIYLNNLDVKNCLNYYEYKSDYKKAEIKLKLSFIYKSKLYFYIDSIYKNNVKK